jgi:hypothetical protein
MGQANQGWKDAAMRMSDQEVADVLTGDGMVGAWQVIAALIVHALKTEAIADAQIDQALEGAVITLAMHSFGEAMEAMTGDFDTEPPILDE